MKACEHNNEIPENGFAKGCPYCEIERLQSVLRKETEYWKNKYQDLDVYFRNIFKGQK
jgi:hypothetical protein